MIDGVDEANVDKFRAFVQWSAFPKGMLTKLETYEVDPDDEDGETEVVPALQDMPQYLAQFLDDGCRRGLELPPLQDVRDQDKLTGKVPTTIKEVAAILNVSSRILYKWKKLDAFDKEIESFMADWAGTARQRMKMKSWQVAQEGDAEAQKEREMWLQTFGDVSDEKTINVEGEITHVHESPGTASEAELLQAAIQELKQDQEIRELPLSAVKTMLRKMVRMVMGHELSQEVLQQVDQDALRTPEEINEHGGEQYLLGDGSNSK